MNTKSLEESIDEYRIPKTEDITPEAAVKKMTPQKKPFCDLK
jgi:hypothetical protein